MSLFSLKISKSYSGVLSLKTVFSLYSNEAGLNYDLVITNEKRRAVQEEIITAQGYHNLQHMGIFILGKTQA